MAAERKPTPSVDAALRHIHSLCPMMPVTRLSAVVRNRNDHNFVCRNSVDNRVGKAPRKHELSGIVVCRVITHWSFKYSLKSFINFACKRQCGEWASLAVESFTLAE